MEQIIVIIITIIFLVILRLILGTSIKKLEKFRENKELNEIIKELPENIEIAKSISIKLGNENVNIKEEENLKATIYMVFNNTISIAKGETNYTRLQTVAHECLHSVQNKKMLWFNYIFSNIQLLYFIVITILTLCNLPVNWHVQTVILLLSEIVWYVVRSYLETDAMTKAKYLAKEYLDEETNLSEDKKQKLLKEYEELNTIGIPFTCYSLLRSSFIKIIIYAVARLI